MSLIPIQIKIKKVTWLLGICVAVIALLGVTGQAIFHLTDEKNLFGMIRFFNLNAENNLPTFLATLLLAVSTLLLLIITLLERQRGSNFMRYWWMLTGGFLFISLDEMSSLHELLLQPYRAAVRAGTPGTFHYSWIIFGVVVVLILGVIFTRFLKHLPAPTRKTFILAGLAYFGGAIGVEMLGGLYIRSFGSDNLPFTLIAHLEETLEMTGAVIFINGLLHYLADQFADVSFHVE